MIRRKKKVTEASGREFLFTSGYWCCFCTQFMTPKRDMQISNKKRKVMMSHHLSRKDVKTAHRRHKEWSYHQSNLERSIEACTEKRNKPTHGMTATKALVGPAETSQSCGPSQLSNLRSKRTGPRIPSEPVVRYIPVVKKELSLNSHSPAIGEKT